jgi:membrane protease YdiL (CAAX protease family)
LFKQCLAAIYGWFTTAFIRMLAVWGAACALTIVWARLTKAGPASSGPAFRFTRPGREATFSLLVVALILSLLFPLNTLVDRAGDAPLVTKLLVQIVVQVLMCSPVIFALIIRRQNAATVALARRNLPQLLLLGVCLSIVTVLLFAILPIPGPNPPAQDTPLTAGRCAYIILTMAISAFAHEFVYRGYLQTRLAAWGGESRGLLFSALVYTFWHLPRFLGMFNWLTILVQILGLFALGLALGEIRRRTGSIVPSTFFHAANDIALTIW